MMDNPFAWVGRKDCLPCKDRRFRNKPSPKPTCSTCKGRTYTEVCLLCEQQYPQDCRCYDWMYDEPWFWEAVNRK